MWVWWPVADVREWVQAKPTNQIKCSQLFSLLTMSEPRSLVTTLTELVLSRQAEQREWKWVWSCVTQCMNHVAQSSSLRSSHAQHFSLSQPCYQTLPAHTSHTQLSCLQTHETMVENIWHEIISFLYGHRAESGLGHKDFHFDGNFPAPWAQIKDRLIHNSLELIKRIMGVVNYVD